MSIADNIVSIVRDYLVQELKPYTIILFGSSVKGYFREDSDIDIAFISAQEFKSYDLYLLAQALVSEVGREIDLVDLRQASTVFKAQILGSGQVIYSNDPKELADFQIRTLKEYALLNEERAEILRNISVRGRVYGG
ncbi:type VII toxin-antitoxin system MntA family adenylyltransferase antitoxin [Desulfosporosinus sp. BICA1-9]|uniref:type VII toxin-antitoxin system MntA family adenylyltransferase antitoxin n=1 Tax=Desulfosporosinus sp. BICA1-9 TaxID=1531958 RepID=UPI00054BEC23|nr:nucleotidyltransferase domain-containing protein [Desulfosporosinus sp. BICA1-9]KJS47405.1 MAG: DNA polymerase subunit beta [Peptococcaceae bacterium BRH_c23]KJS89860.1 MAG: DNA polymerase subunit beta [Desulfosporosinus sp. BICA1-9]HBW34983.1 nucleotidyltransferase domain-containing protein [Desulfosporosinus sp.]